MKLLHEFVEYIPEDINEGILYISLPFGTVVHKCACGCGEEVVTPLGPTEWEFYLQWRNHLIEPVCWQLGFRMQIALLDKKR